jgi:methylenetetrahydrofolate dehydrogenase (NADP+)/methenyltetrahydrofolate cyclohydrolase
MSEAKILYAKSIAEKIKTELKSEFENLPAKPELAIILVGENPASLTYIDRKQKFGAEIGVDVTLHQKDQNISQKNLALTILSLNEDPKVNGIILQLPLPPPLFKYQQELIDIIDPKKDVDGQTTENQGKLFKSKEGLIPATPQGIISLIRSADIDISGKNAVVVGRSNLVGLPTSILLLQQNATVTICHSKTANLKKETQNADILVSAVGQPQLITADYVKLGAVVIDVGMTKTDNVWLGDVDFENVKKVASAISPVPGGVGPLTVAYLFKNLSLAYNLQNN